MFIESQTVELKREIGDMQGPIKTACAFANTHGGKIFFGVDDKGIAVGIPSNELDRTQQRMMQGMRQLSPVPFYEIDVLNENGMNIVQLEVEPMMYGAICSYQGVIYYRHGSVTERAEGPTLQELLVRRKVVDFELSMSRSALDDLDAEAVEAYIKARSPDLVFERSRMGDYLQSLGVILHPPGERVNNAGVIFFHPRPADVLPQVEIKLARFKGTTASHILDAAFLSRPMLQMLSDAERFILRNIQMSFEYRGLDRIEVPEYPTSVIREALVNAVAHRDYFDANAIQINIFDDRIEFMNPGGLPEGLTLETLGAYSVQRNPTIYKLLRDVRKVEGLATGVPRMKEALKEGGYPPPTFEELGGKFFRVTAYNREFSGKEWLSEAQRELLRYVQRNGSITTNEFMELASIPRTTAMDSIRTLVEAGLLLKMGKTKGVKYVMAKM